MTDPATTPKGPGPVVLSPATADAMTVLFRQSDSLASLHDRSADDLVRAFVTALQGHDETGEPATVTIQIGGE